MQLLKKLSYILLMYGLCILPFQSLLLCVDAWKPVVGSTSSFTSTFTLKQSHPDLDSESYHTLVNKEYATPLLLQETQPQPHPQSLLKNEAFKSDRRGVGGGVRGHVNVGSISTAGHLNGLHHITAVSSDSFANYGDSNDDARFDYNHADIPEVSGSVFDENRCAVKKYAFNYDGTVVYNNELPELNQFTICYWMRFTNHSGDHVALTYSVKDEPREVQFWVANAKNSSFISMAIKGQQIYRLNYPLRIRQWHHICSSWNGKTGEWQVWVKAERIGRGFHNSLVSHIIPANGKLYSGGPSITGELSQGLHFETTLIQVYKIALSAGKAHRDHKHHHVHHFDHEGQELPSTTLPPPTINRPLPMHSLLASGQIPTRVRINLAQTSQPQQQQQQQQAQFSGGNSNQAITINTNFVNGQINAGSRLVAQQLLGHTAVRSDLGGQQQLQQQPQISTTHDFSTLNNPANVQFVDETETRIFFKRQIKANDTRKSIRKRANVAAGTSIATDTETANNKEKVLKKRGLLLLDDGSVVEDALIPTTDFKYSGLAEFGGQQFKHDLTLKMNVDDEVSVHDREPAEEEVKAVMALCGACDVEPFEGAIVLAWKDAREDLDNALKGLSVGRCGSF